MSTFDEVRAAIERLAAGEYEFSFVANEEGQVPGTLWVGQRAVDGHR